MHDESLCTVSTTYRQYISLSGLWHIAYGHEGEDFSSAVPQDRQVLLPAALGTLAVSAEEALFSGEWWCERNLWIPKDALGEEIILLIERVGAASVTAFINGSLVASTKDTAGPVRLNLTKGLHYGEMNQLILRLDTRRYKDSIPSGYTYMHKDQCFAQSFVPLQDPEPRGITGNIGLMRLPNLRLRYLDLGGTVKEDGSYDLTYEARVQGNCLVTVTLRDATSRVIGTAIGGQSTITVESPNYWDDDAYCYQIDLEISRLGKQQDCQSYQIGLMHQSCDDRLRSHISNGESITELDGRQSQWHDKLLSLKARGAKTLLVRGANEQLLDLCDSLGLSVYYVLPTEGLVDERWHQGLSNFSQYGLIHSLGEAHHRQIKQHLMAHKHHPSIVAWVLLDSPVSLQTEDRPYFETITSLARSIDERKRPLGLRLDLRKVNKWGGEGKEQQAWVEEAAFTDFDFLILSLGDERDGQGAFSRWVQYMGAYNKVQAETWPLVLVETSLSIELMSKMTRDLGYNCGFISTRPKTSV